MMWFAIIGGREKKEEKERKREGGKVPTRRKKEEGRRNGRERNDPAQALGLSGKAGARQAGRCVPGPPARSSSGL